MLPFSVVYATSCDCCAGCTNAWQPDWLHGFAIWLKQFSFSLFWPRFVTPFLFCFLLSAFRGVIHFSPDISLHTWSVEKCFEIKINICSVVTHCKKKAEKSRKCSCSNNNNSERLLGFVYVKYTRIYKIILFLSNFAISLLLFNFHRLYRQNATFHVVEIVCFVQIVCRLSC